MLERKKLVSIFVKENRQYSKQELLSLISKGKETGLEIIKLLRQFGVLKTVKNLCRTLLEPLLQNKTIQSREIYKSFIDNKIRM